MNHSHGRSRSVSDVSPYQGGVAGMTSIVPVVPPPASQNRAAGSKSGTHDVKGKTKASGEGGEEAEKDDEDFVVEFPTLNPTPGKPAQSSESENAGEGASNTVSEAQSVEQQQPTGWMSPGFAPYPPEMLGYPPWSPQASAYFQPRPYPHPSQMPGASTPSSTSSSPAWTHLGLPAPNAAPVPPPNAAATPPEGGASAQEENLRRQTLVNSITNRPGTSTPSASGSTTSSPRIPFNQLSGAPSAMPPYAQPLSPMTPNSGPVPLMPNPHLMRQGPPPSPGPMAGSWHGSGGYFMPGPVPPPHPQWIAAQNSPRAGTPSGEPAGAAFLASPRSRSSSPFVGGRATPPVQGMYPGYFSPPPHMNYPYGPAPPPPMQHALMMQGMPPTPSPSYANGRRSSANSSPLQSRSRNITASELGASAGGAEEDGGDNDHDSPVGVLGAIDFKDPEGFKTTSSSGGNSHGGSRAASETGGGGSEKGSGRGSPPIEEEPPQTA
ncbi:hypothetical protein FRC00_009517 [Tulasnella sp. 408]|nr:hypothetical protein FRC00_009517 [Tulasnella sp. 408]